MLQLVLEIGIPLLTFVGGIAVGAHNVVTIDKAIATLDTAEKSAAATLAKITAHKTVAPAVAAKAAA